MLAGIIGDVIGSVYEAHQWQNKQLPLIQSLPFDNNVIKPLFKNLKWVRKDYSWTDDTLCTLGLYSAYINKTDPTETLVALCQKYKEQSIGFGKSFEAWLDNPVPYQSFGNGAVMRIGFIPFLTIPLNDQITLAYEYTAISHDHPDSFQAVHEFIVLSHFLKEEKKSKNYSKSSIKQILLKHNYTKTVEEMHQAFSFEMNALETFLQACVIVLESHNIEEVLINSFYVGGDSDTLACIAANLASMLYAPAPELMVFSLQTLEPFPDLYELVEHFIVETYIT